jgi:heme/copper-type cytochrome/quinol oxidase subunit 4
LFASLAAICIIAGVPAPWPAFLLCAAALVMTLGCARVWQRQKVAHHAVLAAAAVAWLAGNLAWLLTALVPPAVPFWCAFLLLTIAGERLELSRFIPTPPAARLAFALIVAALLFSVTATLVFEAYALRGFGVALLALAVWLARYDIARRTLRTPGLTRYMALCLLSGYAWLAVAGMLGAAGGFENGAAWRDAALHALLLGFVFSMVLGHAPIILPAVSTLRFQWHAGFYVPLALLHGGLALRVFAGLTDQFAIRQQAGVANALAFLLFMLLVATSLRPARRRTASPQSIPASPIITKQRSHT